MCAVQHACNNQATWVRGAACSAREHGAGVFESRAGPSADLADVVDRVAAVNPMLNCPALEAMAIAMVTVTSMRCAAAAGCTCTCVLNNNCKASALINAQGPHAGQRSDPWQVL